MLGRSSNLDFIATLESDVDNLEIVDFNSHSQSDSFSEPVAQDAMVDASSCFGTFGTFGSAGGCFGSFGTYGCG